MKVENNSNGTIKAIFLYDKSNDEPSLVGEFLQQVRKEFDLGDAVGIDYLPFSGDLTTLLTAQKEQGFSGTLVFNSVKSVANDIAGLKLLATYNGEFRFLDFPLLKPSTIEDLILLLELKSKAPVQSSPVIRKEAPRGNPNLGSTDGKAVRARKLKSLQNSNNVKALAFVSELLSVTSDKSRSLSWIAEHLNAAGLKTSRNADFKPKTVQRLLERIGEISRSFDRSPQVASSNASSSAPVQAQKKGKEDTCGVAKVALEGKNIVITLNDNVEHPFEVHINNNYGEEHLVFEQVYPADQKQVVIDIDEAALLTGRHYVTVYFKDNKKNLRMHEVILREKEFEYLSN